MKIAPFLVALASSLVACESTSSSLERMYRDGAREATADGGLGSLEPSYAQEQTNRLNAVVEMNENGEILTGKDNYYAALILVSSDNVEHLKLAQTLALKAVQLGEQEGMRVAAESVDKQLLKQGRNQRFGTQFVFDAISNQWRLYPVDPLTTDAERKDWGVPSQAELMERERALNESDSLKKLQLQDTPTEHELEAERLRALGEKTSDEDQE